MLTKENTSEIVNDIRNSDLKKVTEGKQKQPSAPTELDLVEQYEEKADNTELKLNVFSVDSYSKDLAPTFIDLNSEILNMQDTKMSKQ